MNTLIRRLAVAASLLALAGTAAAHPGHDHGNVIAAFGDHLLALAALGGVLGLVHVALRGVARGLALMRARARRRDGAA